MKVGVGYANCADPREAGREAAAQAMAAGGIRRPDFLFAFVAGTVAPAAFLEGLRSVVGEAVPVVGGSAIGVITPREISYRGHPCGLLALEGARSCMRLAAAENLAADETTAGRRLLAELAPAPGDACLLVFYDSIRRPPSLRGNFPNSTSLPACSLGLPPPRRRGFRSSGLGSWATTGFPPPSSSTDSARAVSGRWALWSRGGFFPAIASCMAAARSTGFCTGSPAPRGISSLKSTAGRSWK